jgi:sialidase-1
MMRLNSRLAFAAVFVQAWFCGMSTAEPPVVRVIPTDEQTPHEKCRRAVVAPGENEPDPYPGYTGFVGWQGVCKTKSGALLLTFTSGYWHASAPTPLAEPERKMLKEYGIAEVDAPRGGRAHVMRSEDGGLTWTKPAVLIDTVHDDRSPAVASLADGTLVCSFFTWPTTKVGVIRSTDDGRTWDAEPTYLDKPLAWAATDGPPLELPDKSAVLLATYGSMKLTGAPSVEGIFKSTDSGKTWTHLSTLEAPFDLTEPDIAALPDGRLVTISRREGAVAWSSDQGKTWTKPAPLPFKMYDPWLLTLKDGTLVCLHGSYTAGKMGLRAILSPDGGKTWHAAGPDYGFPVDPTVYGYSRGVQLDDGSVFIVYQYNGGHTPAHMKAQQILCLRFKVKEGCTGIDLLPAPGSPAAAGR